MKEILLLDQLRHRGLAPLLGYCVRSEETESTSLQDHGVLAVYEHGTPFYVTAMRDWPIDRRLDTAVQLADLAAYLHRSPLGSLRVADFKDPHIQRPGVWTGCIFLTRPSDASYTVTHDSFKIVPSHGGSWAPCNA